MTLSPKKYVTNFTSSTTNRGVEAKEKEITNTGLDEESTSEAGVASVPAPPPIDDSASYVQVVVQKRGRAGEVRVPRSSSPLRAPPGAGCSAVGMGAGDAGCGVLLLPRSLLLTYTAPPWYTAGDAALAPAGTGANPRTVAVAAPHDHNNKEIKDNSGANIASTINSNDAVGRVFVEERQESTRRKLIKLTSPEYSPGDNGPERVEVYYFERSSGEFLATSDGARDTALERAARRASRRAHALLAEALAVPRLALGAPLALLLQLERCVLLTARGAALGAVQTAADYALKPTLALLFNAVVQPPLVFAGNAARALRDALHPLWLALGDALEPAVRLLQAVRLVHVHVDRSACGCTSRLANASPC